MKICLMNTGSIFFKMNSKQMSTVLSMKHGGASVLLWDCMNAKCEEKIVFIDALMNTSLETQILNKEEAQETMTPICQNHTRKEKKNKKRKKWKLQPGHCVPWHTVHLSSNVCKTLITHAKEDQIHHHQTCKAFMDLIIQVWNYFWVHLRDPDQGYTHFGCILYKVIWTVIFKTTKIQKIYVTLNTCPYLGMKHFVTISNGPQPLVRLF